MAIVRTKIKLTSAIQEHSNARGKSHEVCSGTFDALFDNSEPWSRIPSTIARRLNIGTRKCARGSCYSDPVIFEMNGRECSEDVILVGSEIVIGYVVLNKLDLRVDWDKKCLVPKHPDGAVFRV